MIKSLALKALPHITAFLLFLVISLAYFHPLLEGKQLLQSDITQFRGMSKEIVDYREKTGEETLWTNSMFSGMPAYLISVRYPYNMIRYADRVLSLGLSVPAKYLFLSMAGFYILMLAFRVNPWVGIAGAVAFGFSTYFFIIEAAGHNTKAHAMSYMAPVLAGIVLSFRGKLLLGCAVTGLFLALQLYTNHFQITYYTLLIVIIYGIFELVHAVRKGAVTLFFRNLMFLTIPVILAVAANFTNLYLVWEYGQYSMRGPSELSISEEVRTTGLDKDYILNDYSYGIAETMNLFIPNFKGGASSYDLGTDSEVYRVLSEQGVQGAGEIASGAPAYWGKQRFTAGPVYIGASVIFFFVLALFVLKGRYKWWLLSATLLSAALAWGENFMFLSELFIDYFPGYDRFRTVSMILVIAELTVPLLALLGLREIVLKGPSGEFKNSLKKTLYITGGISLFFAVMPGLVLSFSGPVDQQLIAAGWPDFLVDALEKDRMTMLRRDAFRSFIFVALGGGLVWLFLSGKTSVKWFGLAVALLFLADLWPVNRRFLSSEDFVTPRLVTQPFLKSEADILILRDDDPHYRVYNTARSPFNDAVTSYHHKSIGGYHGAKPGRYQDLIDHHLSRNNRAVLNMLNTKYFIRPGEQGRPQPFINPGALGNAWFVDSVRFVENADEEIMALNDFDPASEAIADRRFEDFIDELQDITVTGSDTTRRTGISAADTGHEESLLAGRDSVPTAGTPDADHIELTSYSPDHLIYRSETDTGRLAVFSEVYYDAGWRSYVNGEETDHFRVNYILRAMVVPAGENEIEFIFRPRGYYTGRWVSLSGSVLLLLLAGGVFWREIKASFPEGADG
ncbi:MAG: YfhO family protein [Bacteroidales bacterium]